MAKKRGWRETRHGRKKRTKCAERNEERQWSTVTRNYTIVGRTHNGAALRGCGRADGMSFSPFAAPRRPFWFLFFHATTRASPSFFHPLSFFPSPSSFLSPPFIPVLSLSFHLFISHHSAIFQQSTGTKLFHQRNISLRCIYSFVCK